MRADRKLILRCCHVMEIGVGKLQQIRVGLKASGP